MERPATAEAEGRYRALVEAAPDGIVVHRAGIVVYANAAAARIFGADDPAQLVGRAVLDLVHPDDRPLVADRIRRIEHEGARTEPAEMRGLRLDGTVVPIEAAGHPVLYDGRIADQSIVRDVTARKRAEEQLAAQHLARPVVRQMLQTLLAHVPVPRAATSDVGRRLASAPFTTLDEALEAFRAMGLGTLRLERASGDRFELSGDDLLERRPGQAQPTCHLSLSFLEGALASLHHASALGSELRCQSMGHERCRFVVKLKRA